MDAVGPEVAFVGTSVQSIEDLVGLRSSGDFTLIPSGGPVTLDLSLLRYASQECMLKISS